MSVNTAHANGGVLIYSGEIILLYCDGVELTIEGNHAKDFSGTKKGKIYLTTHRMIFMNKTEKDNLQSFSFPFFSMTGVELEQPLFGANYIKGVVHAQSGGNWTGKATFKLKFFSGGAIEFGQAMLRAAKMANQNMPPQPPAYAPHQGPYYPAPPPAYMPPPGGVNGFVPPTHAFPDAPPPNSVYTMDMPPPYPGIYPPPYAYPGGQGYPQAGAQGYPQAGAQGYPQAGAQGYPQAGAQGYPGYPAGPPPPGFNAGATAPPGSYPPPYSNGSNVPPGPYSQHSGVAQQPPSTDTKTGAPPIQDFYQDPYNPQMIYAQNHVNGYPQNFQEPPPPYSEGHKKNQ